MKPERWRQIDELFLAALEREPGERAAFLGEACAGDEALRGEVEALLASYGRADSFLETPAVELAAGALSDDVGLETGQRLGRYEIVERIGAGGMGEVYRARDGRLGREVAVKCLPASFAGDPEWLRRFEQEARAAGRINHPNILTIHDIGSHEGHPYLVAELLEGRTLREEFGRGALPVATAVDYALQAARGLEAAHERGIVHRDLKPENLFVTRDGRVKVLDFGLAKVVIAPGSNEATARHLTQSGVVVGTVSYMSPEQARGERVDHRSDVFSFGLVLYEMLTGQPAFRRGSAVETMHAIIRDEAPTLSEGGREFSPALEYVVRRCLEKEPGERFQSMREIADALAAATEPTGDVTQRNVATTTGPAEPARPSSLTRAAPASRRMLAAAVVLVAALAGAAYYLAGAGGRPIDSIAVLPFANGSGDHDLDYLSEGISESLINSLSQLPDVKVIARSSSFRYRGDEADPREVARALGVEAVLTGRVAQRGERLLISVELVDARDNTHVWGQQYSREVGDLLAAQAEISREIAERLRVRLTAGEQRQLAKRQTENAEAYQLYLKGRYFWNQRTQEGVESAIVHFQQAIARDPEYALAYAGLADSYSALGVPDALLASRPPREVFPAAREAALQALEIDPDLAEAHTSMAHVHWHYDWDWAAAEREFRRSIELKPSYVLAHYRYGLFLMIMGRAEEAIAEMRRARELDPVSLATNANLAYVLYGAGRYDEAIEQCRRTLEMDPNFALARHRLGLAYEQKGMYEEAIEAFRAAATPEGNQIGLAALGHAYALSGRRAEAREVLERLHALSRERFVSPYHVAAIHAGLGEADEAFAWLERAYEARSSDLLKIAGDPQFDNIRADPRFRDLTRRVGLTP